MNTIDSLIERLESVAPLTPCGAVLDRFLDNPACDLLPVAEDGRVLGVVARGLIRAEDVARPVREVMAAAFPIDREMSLIEARALWLAHRDPIAGLVVLQDGFYYGVVSARALMRAAAGPVGQGEQAGFLGLVSREMRPPLEGVLAVTRLLQRQHLTSDAQAHVRTIVEHAHAAVAALDDALQLSQIDRAPLAPASTRVTLRELMDAVQAAWQPRAVQCGMTLLVAYDGPPDLAAALDGERVRQVFDKLIEAALGLNQGGAVEAGLQAARTAQGLRLTGRVRDTGGGLSSDSIREIFDASHPAQAEAMAGVGLGLTLCGRLIEQMDGAIRLESNVGAGASVVFELAAPEAVEPEAEPSPALIRAAHVLVVDDNATNRMVAEALCDMFDCSSECAEDGVEAVEAARTGRFDLILMDIRMPRMDGVEATRAIRALPGAPGRVPIIALNANADPEDAQAYLASGIHSVVEKPIKPERLLQAMTQALPGSGDEAVAAA
ncbi:MAG: response regulator [Caulobacteraceae bacterium]|nr:response regulator [Caulobacteraceae bacterium]